MFGKVDTFWTYQQEGGEVQEIQAAMPLQKNLQKSCSKIS
jgi:hypothetical protein